MYYYPHDTLLFLGRLILERGNLPCVQLSCGQTRPAGRAAKVELKGEKEKPGSF